MYSLTFCVRVMLPERHQCMEARSPGRRSNVENAPPAARAHPAECSHYVVISRDGRKLVSCDQGSGYVAIATQPVHRLQIRPIVHN